MRRFSPRLVLRLALADLWAERVLAFCTVLGLAAVLAPLVVLAGLRAGVIEGLRQSILEDPHAREIVTASNRSFPTSLLRSLRARPDVIFLAPKTRTLAAELLMEKSDRRGLGAHLELIPTGPGDPLLPVAPTQSDHVVLSAAAAARLDVTTGDTIVGRLARIMNGQQEVVPLTLTVQAVAPPSAFAREGAFVTLALAVMVEDFQDGVAPAPASVAALAEPQRTQYAGFRLYADRLESVPALDGYLRQTEHIDVVSRAGDVAGLMRIDRNLGLLFVLVSGLGGCGFLVSLGAGLWANVERKRSSLALLRFLGLGTQSLRLFPMAQAALLATLGSAMALGGAEATAWLINSQFADALALDRALCVISPDLAGQATGVTLLGALLVAAAAGPRAASVEAWEGVTAT
jgi:putative ABC transport system permease protein